MTEEATTKTNTIKIEDIIIGNRFRKDLGDIDSLANDIKDVGLLEPVGITPENKLIFGARRIEAYKRLGRTEIPVNIIPLDDIIKGQIIENTARKDFTFSERQAILQEIERQRIGHRVSKERVADLQPFQQDNKGKKSVDIVAEYIGTSPRQLSKEKAIVQKIKQKPQLKHIIDKLDSDEISVNEAEKEIEFEEEYDAEQKKMGKWRRLRDEVMKEDGNKCRECEDASHLDVYTITPYHDKYNKGNLETLCKDCHELKMEFYDEFALPKKLTSIFQYLTCMSGKKWFQYDIVGYLAAKKEKEKEKGTQTTASSSIGYSSYDDYMERMAASPYAKLKRAPIEEFVSTTRQYRKSLVEKDKSPIGDREIYFTQSVLHDLLPILRDYSEMIDKEAEARRTKAVMEGV
jgi:ParB-like chromosome segregation protein Spo0J